MNTRAVIAIVGGASVVSAVVGIVGGYIYAQKKLTTEYENAIQQEIEDLKDHYARKHKADKYATPQEAVEELVSKRVPGATLTGLENNEPFEQPEISDEDLEKAVEFLKKEKYIPPPQEKSYPQTPVPVPPQRTAYHRPHNTIFDEVEKEFGDADADYEPEDEQTRRSSRPYVISHDVYHAGELNYAQISLTYYRGDGQVVDDEDGLVDDTEALFGGEHMLTKFGELSGDPRLLFVRNDSKELDIEILLADSSYSKAMFGISEEEGRLPVRSFRGGDD